MNIYIITIALIALSAAGSVIRIFIGPTIWDRLLGLGLTTSKITLAVMLTAFLFEQSYILDIAMLFSLLGFLITVLLATFIENKGAL
ncbi:MAG: monovalent cation/H+ antiporter complex subunit F [Kiritimatiellia bacterium]